MNFIEHIKNYLTKIGAEEVSEVNVDKQEVLGFNYLINKKKINIALFHGSYEDRIMFQIYSSLPNAYKEPDASFYKIIDKLNVNSMLGYLFFAETEGDYFISYKSNMVFDIKSDNYTNIELFITTSLQMISINHSKLNVI